MIDREICIDANVFIAALAETEKDHPLAKQVLQFGEMNSFFYYEPALVLYEFASAFHQKREVEGLSDEDCEKKIELFSRLPIVFQWKDPMIIMGIRAAKTLGLKKTYDLAYLAVAEYRDIPLITLDDQLRKRGKEIFDKIFTPEEFLSSVT